MSQKVEKKAKNIPKCLRPEEFLDLIKEIPRKDYKARIGFLLAYGSGLRVSEVLNCKKESFRDNSIFISEAKNKVQRIVPIPKGWKIDFLAFLPLKTTARSLERKFKKYSEKANLSKDYTFHSLRHGFATRSLESGIPINQVQLLLGHQNLSTTSIYVRANPIDALKNYEKLF